MKKLLVVLLAFSFSAGAASAQTTTAPAGKPKMHHGHKGQKANLTPEQRADKAAKKMAEKLSLTAAQTTQVRQLHLARIQEMQAHKAQAGTTAAPADKKQHHAAMKAGKQRYEAQLKQILSAEQYAKYTQLQAERMQKRKAHRQSMAAPQQGKS
ncbi:DUF4890 domain-containing protein [Hymenobacter sp. J193]|uniref:DUF4890 domain-containing protein n=1 Tax=Hymenobacter sp. J193 TaxID=2898429 RepID=UPI002151C53E|nr:DUF4890 domain-containing protein [Hymenobacter sp. J193]MCR5889635.1 DUF4890 domain-containing protein [Hymenobacter sp. J193]